MSDQLQGKPALPTQDDLEKIVRTARQQAGLTRRELAATVNLSATTLRAIEAGMGTTPPTWHAISQQPCMGRLRAIFQRQGYPAHFSDRESPTVSVDKN